MVNEEVLKAAIEAQSEEEDEDVIRKRAGSSSESEPQFNIETVHNENHFVHEYQPTLNEDGNIKTTTEVNMDDIVLMQISK